MSDTGERVSGRLTGLAEPMLTPQSTASEELIAAHGTSACRQLEWDAGATPYRSDSASSTQPRPSRASRAGPGSRADMGSHSNSGSGAAVPEPALEQGPLHESKGNGTRLPAAERGVQSRGEQASRQVSEQLAPPQRDDPTLDEKSQHELDMSELDAKDQDSSHNSVGGSACLSEKNLPEKGRLLKQKLFEALRGAPEGPIELDPAMLYSPASSLQPPSSRSGTPEQGHSADGSAAHSASQERRSATVPR